MMGFFGAFSPSRCMRFNSSSRFSGESSAMRLFRSFIAVLSNKDYARFSA
jgi:hypothetical protein